MKHWESLKTAYQRRGMCLFLGAGVSIGAGMPSWETLLRKLWKSDSEFDQLVNAGLSWPAIASLLEIRKGGKFKESVRSCLYHERDEVLRGAAQSTLGAASALCVIRNKSGGGPKFLPNPKVHAIVNFNFDSLFTKYLRKRYDERIVRTVETPAKAAEPLALISCYHPHGRLNEKSVPEDSLVFTEQGYFDFYSRPNSTFHYTALYLLREYHCLFLGMSFKDDGLRRLLHYSVSERRQSYSIEKGPHVPEQKMEKNTLRHFAIFQTKDYPEQIREWWEVSLRSLGVRALWVAAWKDLPEELGRVYGHDWGEVYSVS